MDLNKRVDYLVYGHKGYFGSHVVKHLKLKGKSFAVSNTRIENRESLIKDFDQYRPKWVICAAGLAGNPNINWFETNKQEAIRVNLMATLNIVDLCFQMNIHCTVFGTGLIYTYDENHPLGSGIGFTEDDKPNYDKLYYVKLRIMLEQLLIEYPNVLNLRVLYPISDDEHPKSLLSKLLNFKKIIGIPNSITVIDDLWPLIFDMCEMNLTGNFNFTNPGVIDNNQIMELYKKHVDPKKEWEIASQDEVNDILKLGRPNQELDVSKLLKYFPDLKSSKESIESLMIRIKDMKSHQHP